MRDLPSLVELSRGEDQSFVVDFLQEIKAEYTWLQEHTRTRKRGRVQRYKFNAKQGRQVRPKLLLFSAAQSTDGDNEMGTHCSFANGSAKAFGAFAVKLRDNGDIHYVQALFLNKDDQVVPANYPAVARTITEKNFPSKFKPEEPSNLSSDINRSLSAWVQDLCSKTPSMNRPLKCLRVSKAPVCQPETLKPARVRRAKGRKPGATVLQEHHDQSAFEGTVKKTKNAKQDDGAINKIRDKLDQQAKSLDAAAAAINKLTDKLNNTHEKSVLDSGLLRKIASKMKRILKNDAVISVQFLVLTILDQLHCLLSRRYRLLSHLYQLTKSSCINRCRYHQLQSWAKPRSPHRVVQLSRTLQFHNFLTLSLFLFLVTAVGRFIKHHLIPLRTAMQKRRKRKRILVSAELLLKGRKNSRAPSLYFKATFSWRAEPEIDGSSAEPNHGPAISTEDCAQDTGSFSSAPWQTSAPEAQSPVPSLPSIPPLTFPCYCPMSTSFQCGMRRFATRSQLAHHFRSRHLPLDPATRNLAISIGLEICNMCDETMGQAMARHVLNAHTSRSRPGNRCHRVSSSDSAPAHTAPVMHQATSLPLTDQAPMQMPPPLVTTHDPPATDTTDIHSLASTVDVPPHPEDFMPRASTYKDVRRSFPCYCEPYEPDTSCSYADQSRPAFSEQLVQALRDLHTPTTKSCLPFPLMLQD
eukprot:g67304.t1